MDALPGDGVCATADGVCSLRAAVQEANALTGVHAITLPDGTYTLTIPGSGGAEVGDLDIGAVGRTYITVNGSSAAAAVINANNIDRAFSVAPGLGSLTLNDVTVQNGSKACILVEGALALNRVVVRGCNGDNGGAIEAGLFGFTAVTLVDTTITENASSYTAEACTGSGYLSHHHAFHNLLQLGCQ